MPSNRQTVFALILMTAFSTGCLFRSHKVESRLSNAQLKTASSSELIAGINAAAAKIKTMNATVDIDTSVGGQKKGKITEYQEIRGYILAEKPAMLRMIGLFPIVRNRAFDMVSNGETFKLWIPPKNRFIMGSNEVTAPSQNPLENLRPQVIYDALLLREIDPQHEVAVLENSVEQVNDPKSKKTLDQPNYIIDVIRRDQAKDQWYLSRKIYIDRVDLDPYRQVVYDKQGEIATDATYGELQNYEGVAFPSRIVITRPKEEYTIGLKMVSLKLNIPLKPDQFELNQPPGAEVRVLGKTSNNAAAQANSEP
jgi:outer membrane lipoprotein-sorting protein